MNSKNTSTSLRGRVPLSTSNPSSIISEKGGRVDNGSENIEEKSSIPSEKLNTHVLSRNLEHPPDKSIGTPQRNDPFLKVGRVVFFSVNAGMSLFLTGLLCAILIFKEVLVYEPNLYILIPEILVCLVMLIINFKEGLRWGYNLPLMSSPTIGCGERK